MWRYLEGLADGVGLYQDPEQHFNSLFAGYGSSPGGGVQRSLAGFVSTRKMDKANLTMKLDVVGGKEITVPFVTAYVGPVPFNFTSGDEL